MMAWMTGSERRSIERAELELKKTAEEAEDLLNSLRISHKNDQLLLNHATRLVQDVEGLVMKLENPDTKLSWRMKLEELQSELQMATKCTIIASASQDKDKHDPSPQLQEVVGDIDDLLNGLNLDTSTDDQHQKPPTIPGRKFIKVVRSPSGPPTLHRQWTLDSKAYDVHDAVGQDTNKISPKNPVDNTIKAADDEITAEKLQAKRYPTKPLRVELPVTHDIAVAAAVASGGGRNNGDGNNNNMNNDDMITRQQQHSHGSADSTIAHRGGDQSYSSDSDDSITSPENHEDTATASHKGFH